jgi:hypothetical protein
MGLKQPRQQGRQKRVFSFFWFSILTLHFYFRIKAAGFKIFEDSNFTENI